MQLLNRAVATAAALLTSTSAAAGPATPPVSQARASDSSKDQTVGTVTGEKVICRRDKEIGSRVKASRVCMTAAQWATRAAEQRQYIEQRQAQRTRSD